jgi:hypothetical protein
MSTITFLSSCKGVKYSKYILPFLFSTLNTSKNAFAEVLVDDVAKVEKTLEDALEKLRELFGDRFKFVPYDLKYTSILGCGATARYYTKPYFESDYTLISDLDIFYTETNIEDYYDEIFKTKLIGFPYSSIKRNGKEKMAGTFCVRTGLFYNDLFFENLNEYFNEVKEKNLLQKRIPPFDIPHYNEFVNYQLIARTHGLPTREMNETPSVYRKIHGIHTSPNRPPRPLQKPNDKFPHWDLTEENISAFKKIEESNNYQHFYLFFDLEYQKILSEFYL